MLRSCTVSTPSDKATVAPVKKQQCNKVKKRRDKAVKNRQCKTAKAKAYHGEAKASGSDGKEATVKKRR